MMQHFYSDVQVFKLCHCCYVTSLVFVVVIVQKQRRDEEEAKRKEIEALQSQLKQLQEMAAQQQKGGVSTTAAAKSDRVAGKKAKPKERPPPPPPETNDDDTNTLYQIDRCVFMMQIFLSNGQTTSHITCTVLTKYLMCFVERVFSVVKRTKLSQRKVWIFITGRVVPCSSGALSASRLLPC